jgi:maleylacetate reductase
MKFFACRPIQAREIKAHMRAQRIIHGSDLVENIASEAQSAAGRVFIVLSGSVSRNTSVLENLQSRLGERFAGFFDRVHPHAPESDILAAIEMVRNCQPTIIVSIGGGSVIDLSKIVHLALAEGLFDKGAIEQYSSTGVASYQREQDLRLNTITHIAAPTTLSGAEYTGGAGYLNESTGKKSILREPGLLPSVVVLDPQLALKTPDWLWFSTGARSIDHAVETLCSPQAPASIKTACMAGLETLRSSLITSKRAPVRADARLRSLLGVWLATRGLELGFSGASHGISYSLATISHVSHGHCSCVLLPAVMRFNSRVCEADQREVATVLEQLDGNAATAVTQLFRELGLPTSLAELGVPRSDLPQIAEASLSYQQVLRNPRPIQSTSQIIEILEDAYS